MLNLVNHLSIKKGAKHMNHKSMLVAVIAIAIISGLSHLFDFGHGLTWEGFSEPQEFILLLLRFLFLSLVVERIIEFYVVVYRLPERNMLELALDNSTDDQKAESQQNLRAYRAQTGRIAALVGFIMGVAMAATGIRVFTDMFDFTDASAIQIVMFDALELFVMGALMAGGSKGINQIVGAIESFSKNKRLDNNYK